MREHPRWWWNPLRWCVFALDAMVRRASTYRELDNNPDFLFRIQYRRSPHAHRFADGTQVNVGDPIIEIHLWNEHIPPMPETGPDLAWAQAFYRRFRNSLRVLAQHVATSPDLREVRAVHGRIFVDLGGRDPATLMLRRLGFEFERVPEPDTIWGRIGRFFVTMYAGWLIWAYNPGSLKTASIWQKDLIDVWMSRARLLQLKDVGSRSRVGEVLS